MAYFYRQNNFKSSSAFENVSVHSTKSTDLGILLSLQRSDTCWHSKTAKTIKRRRDQGPSRISMNKVFKTAKIRRKARSKFKVSIRKYLPKSSWLYSFANDFKFCHVRYLNRCEGFFTKFVKLNKLTAKKSKLGTHAPSFNHKKLHQVLVVEDSVVSRMKLLTLGDVELNPGPLQGVNTQITLSLGSTMLLNFRLHRLGLRPLDVGGAGDCFFRAVSHQLYGDPSCHLQIRQDGMNYLRTNPENFIESNTHSSWDDYLVNMSLQSSCCDAIIVQAVAESQNLRIHIVESNENFSDTTLIEPVHLLQQPPTTIYLGHVNEEHYVSTVPYMCSSSSLESQHIESLNKIEQKVVSEESHNASLKREKSMYMREYRKKKKASESRKQTSKINEVPKGIAILT